MDPISIELDGAEIVVTSGFRDKDLIKQVPGTRWDTDLRRWHVPLSWSACHAFRGVFQDRLQIGLVLAEWAQSQQTGWIARTQILSAQSDTAGHPDEYPFQRIGTEWLLTVGQGLLADEMGVGKTVQVAAALDQLTVSPEDPVLIVCPNSVKRVWLDHLAHWAPKIRAEIIQGGAAKRRKTFARLDEGAIDCVIINWEALRLHSRLAPYGSIALTDKERTPGELNRHWLAVVADEAHHAKSPTVKQTRALWATGADSQYRWALTGTPIANAPDDLWAVLHFVHATEWPAKSRFVDRFALQSWSNFGGMKVIGLNPLTSDELWKSLGPRFLRRTKAQVLPDLPPKVYETRFVELSPKERKAYTDMRDKLVTELDSGDQVVGWNPLTESVRMMQFASASIEATGDGYRLCEPSAKLDVLDELLEDLDGEPVVVAAVSRQLIELYQERLDRREVAYGSVHGAISPEARARHVDDFQQGRTNIMLLTVGAGAEGITLTRASTMVYLQRPWSMIDKLQSEDRLHRHGQTADQVLIIDLVTQDTIEEKVFAVLDTKEGRLEELVNDKARLRELL